MKYSIQIEGMHCTGCVNLIKMTFEDDLGFDKVSVDLDTSKATFESNESDETITEILNSTFKKDLTNYKYSNLVVL